MNSAIYSLLVAVLYLIRGMFGAMQPLVATVTLPVCCCPMYRGNTITAVVTVTQTVDVTSTRIVTSSISTPIAVDYTTTISGPSDFIQPTYNFNDLVNQFAHTLHKGVIGYFPNWTPSSTLVGVCGKDTDSPTAKYWAAVTTKYLRADSHFYPDPNLHPLCGGTFCVKVFGPSATWVMQIYDSFSSPASEEDIAVPRAAYTAMGYTDDVNVVYWRFVRCPAQLGPV